MKIPLLELKKSYIVVVALTHRTSDVHIQTQDAGSRSNNLFVVKGELVSSLLVDDFIFFTREY